MHGRSPKTIRLGRIAAGAAGLVIAAACSRAQAAAEWPQWRGPDRNGISSETGWFAPGAALHTVWTGRVGVGYSSVAVAGGRLVTMGNSSATDRVVCVNARTGDRLWTYAYACAGGSNHAGPRATPTVAAGRVYTVSRDARVFCLDGATGKMIWGRELSKDLGLKSPEWGFAGSPLLWGSRVVLNLGTAGVALDQATGRTVWDTGAEPSGYASPVLYTRAGGKPTLAMFGAKGFLARDAATGAALWDYPWETQYNINAADPLIADGKAFITSGYGRGCALLDISKDQPRELWTGKAVSSQFSSVVLWKGCLYGVNGNVGRGDVRCLDFQTGEMKWSDEGSLGFGSLILADGKLIVLSEKGELAVVAASPDGCNALLRGRVLGGTCWTPPVLCDGLIYCRNDRGDLACVRVGAAGQ